MNIKVNQAGMEILKPHLASAGVEPIGTVVLGTVKGDLHGNIKTAAQSITTRKAETVASVLLLQSYRLRQDFVEQVPFFQTDGGRFNDIADTSQPVALALSICISPKLTEVLPQSLSVAPIYRGFIGILLRVSIFVWLHYREIVGEFYWKNFRISG